MPRPRAVALTIALGTALILTLAACGSAADSHASARRNRGRAIAAGEGYVAMGDSYTAAPYNGPQTADDGCLQSSDDYPHRLAQRLGLSLTDVSCGGATTASLTGPQTTSTHHTRPPQDSALRPDTALVTVSIGGNDGDIEAAITTGCLAWERGATSGAPCATTDAAADGKDSGSKIARMEHDLEEALRTVATKAPRARIVVVGYPSTVPSKPCAQFPLTSGDLAWAARLSGEVARAQRRAATAVGAEFVDMSPASAGHDICAADPWVAGLHPNGPAAAFHPYPAEQQAVADAIAEQLATGR